MESILLSSLAFYALVISFCELSRQVVTQTTDPNSLTRRFAYELLGTLQVCTCVYENGLIVKNYGVPGFFIAVVILLLIHGTVNRGAFINPANNVELFTYGKISAGVFMVCLLGELVGGYLAFRMARQLWWFNLSLDHARQYSNFPCKLAHKVSFPLVCLYELVCCFIIRYVIGMVAPARKRYAIAFSIAFFLSMAIILIGVPGLNPIIASSRIMNCEGLSTPWFVFTYWMCPITGHLMAAAVQDRQNKRKIE